MSKEIIGNATLYVGDCLDVLPELRNIDAVVCDPPYHLTSIVKRFGGKNAAPAKPGKDGAFARASGGFMGKQWDGGDIAFRPETWRLVHDAMRPGAYLVAFASTRGYHRMVCAIEDAGFVIHPMLGWLFGTGFPKAHKVESPEWQGWKYGLQSLKPALEPICLAQRPMEGTGTANVLANGTGALNIDACRIAGEDAPEGRLRHSGGTVYTPVPDSDPSCKTLGRLRPDVTPPSPAGRYPANLIHDGSPEVMEAFAAFGELQGRGNKGPSVRQSAKDEHVYSGGWGEVDCGAKYASDSGTAARFFKSCPADDMRFHYSAKASKADRAGSKHPTVKPQALMRYLVRLVTPPGGTVLDCFAGSGSTLQAALAEGFSAVGIEREAEYAADIRRRLGRAGGQDAPVADELEVAPVVPAAPWKGKQLDLVDYIEAAKGSPRE